MSKLNLGITAHGPFKIISYWHDNSCQITLGDINHQPGDATITLFLRNSDQFRAILEAFDTTDAENLDLIEEDA
jgi:hypothetical protein